MTLSDRQPGTRHQTTGALEAQGDPYADFTVGQRVLTREGLLGTVTAVSDGPHAGNEDYEVVLDNGMGGGTWGGNELSPAEGSTATSTTRTAALAHSCTAACAADCDGTTRVASDSYPELEAILLDRPPPAHATRVASLQAQGGRLFDKFLTWNANNMLDKVDPGNSREKWVPGHDWSYDWCAYRSHHQCYFPGQYNPTNGKNETSSPGQARGDCSRKAWPDQQMCPSAAPGQHAGELGSPTASVTAVDISPNPRTTSVVCPSCEGDGLDALASMGVDACARCDGNRVVVASSLNQDEHAHVERLITERATWRDQRMAAGPVESAIVPTALYVTAEDHQVLAGPVDDHGHAADLADYYGGTITLGSALEAPHWTGRLSGITSEAAWKDVRTKAQRISKAGGVRIISATHSIIAAHVHGDKNDYESVLEYVPGTRQVGMWTCGCAWAAYVWGRSEPYKRFEGRMCFIPGMKVSMADGTHKSIEEVRPGDGVLTHDGVGTVRNLWENQYHGEIVGLTRAGSSRKVWATADHGMLANASMRGNIGGSSTRAYRDRKAVQNKQAWVRTEAGQLQVGDWLMGTYVDAVQEAPSLSLSDLHAHVVVREGRGRLETPTERSGRIYTGMSLPEFSYTEPFAVVLGYYLAEGNVEHFNVNGIPRIVQWTFGAGEDEYVQDVVDALGSLGAGTAKVYRGHNRILVKVSNATLALLLARLAGTHAATKFLHPDLMKAPLDFQEALLRTYLNGDGCESRAGTASIELARQFVTIGCRIGHYVPREHVATNNLGPHNRTPGNPIYYVETAGLYMQGRERLWENYYGARITGVERQQYCGPVYNLNVDGQHTYAVEDTVVFNCSHALATLYQAQSRGMFGREVREDAITPAWRMDPTLPMFQPGSWDKDKGKHVGSLQVEARAPSEDTPPTPSPSSTISPQYYPGGHSSPHATEMSRLPEASQQKMHKRIAENGPATHGSPLTQEHMVQNIMAIHRDAKATNPKALEEGSHWYDDAHKTAEGISTKHDFASHGLTKRHAMGMVAAVSPQNDWDQNVAQADHMAGHLHRDTKVNLSEEHHTRATLDSLGSHGPEFLEKHNLATVVRRKSGAVKSIDPNPGVTAHHIAAAYEGDADRHPKLQKPMVIPNGKHLSEMDDDHAAHAIKAMGKYQDDLRVTGPNAASTGKPNRVSYSNGTGSMAKAVGIFRGKDPDEALQGHKVRSFFNNIADPRNAQGGHHLTIDTHAVSLACQHRMSAGSKTIKAMFQGGSSTKDNTHGTYALVADAYREAHHRLKESGEMHKDSSPSDLQAGTWLHWRKASDDPKNQARFPRAAAVSPPPQSSPHSSPVKTIDPWHQDDAPDPDLDPDAVEEGEFQKGLTQDDDDDAEPEDETESQKGAWAGPGEGGGSSDQRISQHLAAVGLGHMAFQETEDPAPFEDEHFSTVAEKMTPARLIAEQGKKSTVYCGCAGVSSGNKHGSPGVTAVWQGTKISHCLGCGRYWHATDADGKPRVDRQADLHEEPEPALPTTDGAEEDDEHEPMQRGAALNVDDPRSWLMQAPAAAGLGDADIAGMAGRFLKEGMKAFTPEERTAIIGEGEGTRAANLGRLDIKGTHYEGLDALDAQDEGDDGWLS